MSCARGERMGARLSFGAFHFSNPLPSIRSVRLTTDAVLSIVLLVVQGKARTAVSL